MSFPCDGRNHRKAIESESSLLRYKDQIEIFFNKKVKNIVHIGGTKTKIDDIIYFEDDSILNVSLKNKEKLNKGSFDYTNMSRLNNLCEKAQSIYKEYINSGEEKAYSLLNKSISDELSILDSTEITRLFTENVYKKYKEQDISLFVLDESNDKLYCDVNPPSFKLIENNGIIFLKKGKKQSCSYRLFGLDKNYNEIDLGLRIRVHINNGKSAWLNLNGKGKSSTLCLKFQQDRISKIIEKQD